MTKVDLFIKERGVSFSEIEKFLGLSPKSLRIDRGIPEKHLKKVIEYLRQQYGYEDENSVEEVDIPEEKPEKVVIKVWNKNFIPKWKDGIVRYQDPRNGLWKRLMTWQTYVDSKTKEIVYNKEFFSLGTEEFEDKIGKYVLAKNGIKVYSFKKE